jgi:hypothetical protein
LIASWLVSIIALFWANHNAITTIRLTIWSWVCWTYALISDLNLAISTPR